MRHFKCIASSVALSAAFSIVLPVALAQESSKQTAAFTTNTLLNPAAYAPGKVLTGTVQRQSLRLNRLQPGLTSADSLMNSQLGKSDMQAGIEQGIVSVQDYAATITRSAPPPVLPAPTTGNYVWGLSHDGGYYDASGQIKVVVPGNELYKYGGKFMDGSIVPTTPVVTNFANHAYRFPYVIRRSN